MRIKSKRNPWRAQIRLNKANTFLGYYPTEIDAARAYDRAARAHYGRMAMLNFPDDPA